VTTSATSRHTVRLRSRGHARADPRLALAVAGLAGDMRAEPEQDRFFDAAPELIVALKEAAG
jgi:hypothetical protein